MQGKNNGWQFATAPKPTNYFNNTEGPHLVAEAFNFNMLVCFPKNIPDTTSDGQNSRDPTKDLLLRK